MTAAVQPLQNLRIKFKAFDSGLLEKSVSMVICFLKKIGANVCGPVPLPSKIEKFTVNRSPHIDRKAMDQFEISHHRRLLIIFDASPEIVEELSRFDLHSGIGVEIKILRKN